MKTLFLILIAGFLFSGMAQAPAQGTTDWQTFKNNADNYYLALEHSAVKNFSCLFTTGAYLGYCEDKYDSSYTYPLKLIWTREGKIYYVLQPYPAPLDSVQHHDLFSRIQAVSQQFKGFMLDLQSFLITTPFSDIPEDARVDMGRDSVVVHYQSGEGDLAAKVDKLFLPSGKLIQVVVRSRSGSIVNFPIYSELEGKWVCTGWNSQIYKNGNVDSGIATRMELSKQQGLWLPGRVSMLIQSSEKPESKYMTTIFLKDFQFDIPLQKIEAPTPARQGN